MIFELPNKFTNILKESDLGGGGSSTVRNIISQRRHHQKEMLEVEETTTGNTIHVPNRVSIEVGSELGHIPMKRILDLQHTCFGTHRIDILHEALDGMTLKVCPNSPRLLS